MSDKKDYEDTRNPETYSTSLPGVETGYLLRLLMRKSVNEDCKKLIKEELKSRGFSDEEIRKYEFL